MGFIDLVLVGVGLAMDSLSVTIAKTMVNPKEKKIKLLAMPILFGFFQGLMPLIGGILITNFEKYISFIDHWIAFVLLAYIGFNMIKEAIEAKKNNEPINPSLKMKDLLILSIATSIDALSVGIGLAAAGSDVVMASLIAGSVTFIICVIGMYIAKALGDFLKDKAEILGGIILISIGIKILVEHML